MACAPAYGGGYRVSLQGTRQVAMGHTGVGIVMDASNVFFNPAGLSFLKSKWAVSAGVSLLWSKLYYQDTRTYKQYQTQDPMGTPLDFYAAYKINEKLAVGLGLYTPFGSAVKWPEDWDGRALITSIDMKSLFFQPTLSYKVNDWLSLGGGMIFALSSVSLKRSHYLEEGARVALHDGDASGFGYRLSVMAKPFKRWTFGVDYRSKVAIKAKKGNVTLNGFPKSLLGAPWSVLVSEDDHFDATLPLAGELSAGLSFEATQKLLLALDLNYTFWKAYRALDIQFEKNRLGFEQGQFSTHAHSPRNYHNTFTYRLGAQYAFASDFTGRLGYYYDPSPSPDAYWSPETPSTDNQGFTAGFSYKLNTHLDFDAAYVYIHGRERSVNNQTEDFFGQVYTRAQVASFGFSLHF